MVRITCNLENPVKFINNSSSSNSLIYLCRALLHADVIILLGARLNWILHFGLPPRFRQDVKVIQVRRKTVVS